MRILVSGAAGSVGNYLVNQLICNNHDVVAYDFVKGEEKNNVEWVEGDILDYDNLIKSAKGCDAIIHLAAIPIYDPKKNLDFGRVNILGTQTVLEAAVHANVSRVVYASSICANAFIFWHKKRNPKYFPVDEGYFDIPDDMYGLSKLVNEYLAKAYETRYGLETTGLRLAAIWLPNHEPTNDWLSELLDESNDNDLEFLDLRWQYVDVRDVAQAFVLAVESSKSLKICNVGAADCPGGNWQVWISDIYPKVNNLNQIGRYLNNITLPLWSIDYIQKVTKFKPKYSWKEYPVFVNAWGKYLIRREKGKYKK